MTEKILAWHSDPDLKENTLLRMKDHAEQDRFIRGLFVTTPDLLEEHWTLTNGELMGAGAIKDWGGCLHGCLTAENLAAEAGMSVTAWIEEHGAPRWHQATQRFFGIPAVLGRGLDYLYEQTKDVPPAEVAVQLLEAIPVGADLSRVSIWERQTDGPVVRGLAEVLEILRNAPVPGQEEDK